MTSSATPVTTLAAPSVIEEKNRLRREILAARDELKEVDRIEMSLAASEHGLQAPPLSAEKLQGGTIVAGFFPIRSEIDPRPLMDGLAKRGARLCLPVVVDKTTIVFRELVKGGKLVDTGFGTTGPDESAAILEPEIMLVPLSAFDSRGGRMGYGAGHYDRAIEKLDDMGQMPVLLGIGFSIQETGLVPTESHDRFLDGIITEKRFMPVPDRPSGY